ncbi:ARPP-1 family domain-containing protein [Nocardioides pacificus]
MMQDLHIGRGHTRGAMTVFPLWSATSGPGRYTLSTRQLEVSEMDDGPDVGSLMVGNVGDRPALVLEGQLFEGGWQHRMATRPMLIGVHQRIPVEVACVEQGRWSGGSRQETRGRRATPYIREAVRGDVDVQGEVWTRVARHTAGSDNPTGSFVRRLDESDATRSDWSDYRLLPGQSGVLIGVGGQPYVAEVFSHQLSLRRQLQPILEAAALDALHAPVEATPGRRARRFIDRFGRTPLVVPRPAGLGMEHSGRTQYVDASVLRWQDDIVHTRMSNVRHPMLVAG